MKILSDRNKNSRHQYISFHGHHIFIMVIPVPTKMVFMLKWAPDCLHHFAGFLLWLSGHCEWIKRQQEYGRYSSLFPYNVDLTHWPLGEFTEILIDSIFQVNFSAWWLWYLLWNCWTVLMTTHWFRWWLLPSVNKPLPKPVFIKISKANYISNAF